MKQTLDLRLTKKELMAYFRSFENQTKPFAKAHISTECPLAKFYKAKYGRRMDIRVGSSSVAVSSTSTRRYYYRQQTALEHRFVKLIDATCPDTVTPAHAISILKKTKATDRIVPPKGM